MELDRAGLPRHVAIIMDGNGRWAAKRHMPRIFGHQKGADTVSEIVEAAAEWGIEVLTLYAFSSENWGRPTLEVDGLFSLLIEYLRSETERLHEQGIRLTAIGDRDRLPLNVQNQLDQSERFTRHNQGMRLVLALSYGGRADIVAACKTIAREVASGNMSWQDVSEECFSSFLSTWDLPHPDLLIRTSGEQRISNFLLWEIAYAEMIFSPVMWPDFDRHEFQKALEEYQQRDRRYGLVCGKPASEVQELGRQPC